MSIVHCSLLMRFSTIPYLPNNDNNFIIQFQTVPIDSIDASPDLAIQTDGSVPGGVSQHVPEAQQVVEEGVLLAVPEGGVAGSTTRRLTRRQL